MRLTVAICTWNRARLLDQTLTQMHQLSIPLGVQWELVVVNNNCTDETDSVIERHAGRLPIRRVFEPRPGHSNARNCAVDAARGQWILWTDDDVLVDANWAAAYLNAARRIPEASFFGGLIEPWFETPPPQWVLDNLEELAGAFAIRDLGDRSFSCDRDRLPFGANYAVRTEVQRRRRYDPELGRRENEMLSGDETAVLLAILRDGGRGYWIPEARVRHHVPARRLTLPYIRRFYIGLGKTSMRMLDGAAPRSPRRIWIDAAVSEVKWRARRMYDRPERWVKHLVRSSYLWGQLACRPAR